MIGSGEPIMNGGYWTLSGPDIDLGIDQQRGVELAFAASDHEVAGAGTDRFRRGACAESGILRRGR